MKHIFNRVVVLLNDLENKELLLQKGVVFSEEHKCILEVVFVHEVPLFELPDYFLSDESIAESVIDKDKIKKEIQNTLEFLDHNNEYAILVYENDTVDRLLNSVSKEDNTLVITQYHEELTRDLIEKTDYAFWVIKEGIAEYKNIVLSVDLKDKSRKCIEFAQHVFSNANIKLVHDYRYLLDSMIIRADYMNVTPITTGMDIEMNEEFKNSQEKIFNDYLAEYSLEGNFIESAGSLDEDLIDYIKEHHFDLTVMYRNNEDLFFTPTLIVALMKELSTDFFVCQERD
jgi:hypothetical protein